jgi:CelD/BcsL family acetyltransferase involved in cellulose biosynthesis
MKITVHRDPEAIESLWRLFQGEAAGTFYQTFEWCSAWIETAGKAERAEARIVIGEDEQGRPQFLLPFSVRRVHGVRLLEWIGSRQINYGYGLFSRSFLPRARAWFGSEGWQVFASVGEIDAIWLREMPAHLHGFEHPLADWWTITGANQSYAVNLGPDYEQLYAEKRSGETRRGNRKRDAKLEQLGQIRFGLPATPEETKTLVAQMFEHQEKRLAESGIKGVFSPAERQFIQKLADMEDALLPYHLSIDGELAAMMLGGQYDGTYWALISSLNTGLARRHSPGDAALRRMIEACCKSGLRRIDLSSGDTPYKLHWADEAIPLHEAIRFTTLKGAVWATGAFMAATGKRQIKTSALLWQAYRFLRAALRGEAQSTSAD